MADHIHKKIIITSLKTLISGTIMFLTIACEQTVVKNLNSQFYSVKADSTLALNEKIVIQANTARTFFQNGKVVKEKDLNIYYPHCSITVNTITDHNRDIKPTTFTIYKVEDQEEHAQLHVLYASRGAIGNNDGPSIIGQASYYYLKSLDEPDVRTLECVQWGDPYDVRYVSINDIRSVIGHIFTLTLIE